MVYTIKIISDPAGAEVSFNGKSIGTAPFTWKTELGKGTMTATKSGYKDWSGTVTPSIYDGKSFTLYMRKEVAPPPPPPPAPTTITLKTRPEGAAVFLNGKGPVAHTNATFEYSPGDYTLKLEKSGYEIIETGIRVEANKDNAWDFPLTEIIAPPEVPWYEKWFGWTLDDIKAGIFLNPIADLWALAKLIENLLPEKVAMALGPVPDWFYEAGITLMFAPFFSTAVEAMVKAGATAAEANTITAVLKEKGFKKGLDVMKANPGKYAADFSKLDPKVAAQILKGMRKDHLASLARELFRASWNKELIARAPVWDKVLLALSKHKWTGIFGMMGLAGSIMGFDIWSDWPLIDNLQFMSGIGSEDIKKAYKERRITKEEALKQLNDFLSLAKLADEKVSASVKWNPLAIIFFSMWDDIAKLTVDAIERDIKEIEEIPVPEVTALVRIGAKPYDAKIEITGVEFVENPFERELPLREYGVIVSRFGYTPQGFRFTLTEAGYDKVVELEKEVVPPEELEEELTISVAPDETNVFISGHPEITKEGAYTLPLGPYTIYFSLDGYKPHTAYATLKAGKPVTVSHSMIKEEEPEPEKAELLITSKPSFADVMIDGKSTYQKTPYTAFLDEGWHTIRVELSDYEPEEEDIELSWGDEKTKEFILNKVPPTKGILRIESDPPGAQVYIDGVSKYATTPYTITLLAETYKIRLTKDGYISDEADVIVEAGVEKKHEVELKEKPITDARITIASEPTEADIYIDGVYQYAKTPFTKLLKPTTYTIRVQKEGYYPETSYIEFEEGEEATVTFTLTTIPAPEIPPEPYIPYTPYYPTYVPPAPYVPAAVPTPFAEIPPYDYNLLYPEIMAIPGVEPVTPPVDKELLVNIETTDVMPTKGRIYSIAFLDLTTPGSEILIKVDNNEENLIKEFLDLFESGMYYKLVGYNVSFDHRYIFTKMMKYRRASKAWKNIKLRDIMQIMKQVKEEFVFGFNKPGTLDAWGKMILGKGKYGSQELMLRKYMQGDFDYVRAFQTRQIELSRDLYSLARFVSSEASVSSPVPSVTASPEITTPEVPKTPGIPGKKQCPHCFADNPLSATVCEICGAVI